MATCLITGGAGFIGSHLAERLLALGHSVWAVDSFTDFYSRTRKELNVRELLEHPHFHLKEADLCDQFPLPDAAIDYVFHLAAQPGVRSSWGGAFREHAHNNILATQCLLDALSRRPGIRGLVFASSSSVYGNPVGSSSQEDDRVNPLSPYAASKVAGEMLCRVYAQAFSMPVCILRLFTVFGPRQRPDMAIAAFLEAALDGRTVEIYGPLHQRRDYTYVGDVVDAMIAGALSGVSDVFNVGAANPITMAECIRSIEEVTGLPLRYTARVAQPGETRDTHADTSKAARAIAFYPKTSFREGLAAQFRFLRAYRGAEAHPELLAPIGEQLS